MKRIIPASAAIILLIAGAGAAEAQQWQGQNGPGPRDGGPGGPGGPGGMAGPQQQPQHVQPPQQAQPQRQPPRQVQAPGPGGPRGDRVGEPNRRGGSWNNGGQRHQVGRYNAPRGYGVRIWAYGQILPGAYWGTEYVLRDYRRYGLPRPYAGAQWVRSGDDALMVDRRGRVLEVVRNLFW